METIINNQDQLRLHWSPWYFHQGNGKYIPGFPGRGPGDTDEIVAQRKANWKKPDIPDDLAFDITLKYNNAELFNKILQEITDISQTYDKDLELVVIPPTPILSKKVKKEFVGLDNENKRKDAERIYKANLLIEELHRLNVDVDIDWNRYVTPDQWIDKSEDKLNYLNARIEIRCHKGTKFYQVMNENGIFDKYFPEFYAKGEFIC